MTVLGEIPDQVGNDGFAVRFPIESGMTNGVIAGSDRQSTRPAIYNSAKRLTGATSSDVLVPFW